MSEPALKRQKVLNNFDNSESKTEHEDFLKKLNDYEPGLIGIIKYYTKTYTFENRKELRGAVILWNTNSWLSTQSQQALGLVSTVTVI